MEKDGDEKGEGEDVGTQFSHHALMWRVVGSFADIWLSFGSRSAAYIAGHSPKSKPRRRLSANGSMSKQHTFGFVMPPGASVVP